MNESSAVTSTLATLRGDSSGEERVVDRFVFFKITPCCSILLLACFFQVRDEHRTDYDAGRGGWGAQAQKAERERREVYADAMEGPGAVAGGGGDWERGGEGEGQFSVCYLKVHPAYACILILIKVLNLQKSQI